MKTFTLTLIALALFVASCGTTTHVPPENHQTIVHYIDSVRWHDSTVLKEVPVEVYVNIVRPGEKSQLETKYAESDAWTDSVGLHHNLQNKKENIAVQIKWKEKIVYKDSLVTSEVPVPYEVKVIETKIPKIFWLLLAYAVATLGYKGFKLYQKFKPF